MEGHRSSIPDRAWQVLSSTRSSDAIQATPRADADMDGHRCMFISIFSPVPPGQSTDRLTVGSSTRAGLRLLGEVPVRHYCRKG